MPDEAKPDPTAVLGPPPVFDGTKWDKDAPTGPPNPPKLAIPKHLERIVGFFNGIVMDESLLIDLCLERCIGIVERNVNSKIYGVDHFADANPTQYAAIAAPLTVELYKQVLNAISGRQDEYGKLVEEMNREREKNSPGGPRIIVSP